MRVFSALAVCGGCVWTGLALRRHLARRARVCAQIRLLLTELRTRAVIGEPILSLVQSLSEDKELRALSFLSDCETRWAATAVFSHGMTLTPSSD